MESTYSAPWAHPSSLLSGKPRKGENAPQTARSAQAQLKTAIEAANIELARLGIEPICESATPHSLRRTYASMRAALRDDPVYIAEQLGHRDATLTFRMYQGAAKRRERLTPKHLEAFDAALVWAHLGANQASSPLDELVPNATPDPGFRATKLDSDALRP